MKFEIKILLTATALVFSLQGFGQSQCEDPNTPPGGSCCETCTCLYCAQVNNCDSQIPILGDHDARCSLGGCDNCDKDIPGDECQSWTENYYSGTDDGCVPIDGGLGFLIAGGLGMGVLGVRRRKTGLDLLDA